MKEKRSFEFGARQTILLMELLDCGLPPLKRKCQNCLELLKKLFLNAGKSSWRDFNFIGIFFLFIVFYLFSKQTKQKKTNNF